MTADSRKFHLTLHLVAQGGERPGNEMIQAAIDTASMDFVHRAVFYSVVLGERATGWEVWPHQIKRNELFGEGDYSKFNYRFKPHQLPSGTIKLDRVMPFVKRPRVEKPVANSLFSQDGLLRFAVKPKPNTEPGVTNSEIAEHLSEHAGKPVLTLEIETEVVSDDYDWELWNLSK